MRPYYYGTLFQISFEDTLLLWTLVPWNCMATSHATAEPDISLLSEDLVVVSDINPICTYSFWIITAILFVLLDTSSQIIGLILVIPAYSVQICKAVFI